MSTSSTSQAESILAQFPGPVTLRFSRRRILFMLALYIATLALMLWLLVARDLLQRGFISGWLSVVVAGVSVLFWGALAVRAILLLVFPDAASLKLDAEGFEIGHVFRRIRLPWRGVSEFAAKKNYPLDTRIGGPVEQVTYDDLSPDAGQGKTKNPRVLPDLYGQPRIRRAELAQLMNEWRRRALEQAALSPARSGRPPRAGVPSISGARR